MRPSHCHTALDLCGLEPPEPMLRVLEALRELPPGHYLRMSIDREPLPLYAILRRDGFAYDARRLDRARYEIDIWRRA